MARATTGLAYLVLIAIILGSLVFTVFVTLPVWSDLSQKKTELQNAEIRKGDREKFLASIDARKRDLDGHARDVLALAIMFPERQQPENLLATLQSIGGSSGIVVTSVSAPTKAVMSVGPSRGAETAPTEQRDAGAKASAQTSSSPPAPSTEQWETNLEARGTYPQVRAFVRELEQALILTDVQSVHLGVSATNEAAGVLPGTLAAKLVVRTYVQP